MTGAQFILALPCGSLAVPGRALRIEPEPCRLLADGPRLWIGEDTPTVDLGEAGHAIGILFRRDGAQQVRDGLETVACSGLEAASQLVGEFWGAYVAILRMPVPFGIGAARGKGRNGVQSPVNEYAELRIIEPGRQFPLIQGINDPLIIPSWISYIKPYVKFGI